MIWELRELGDICEIARGGSPRPIQEFITNAPSGVNWIKISDATASGKYIYSTKEKITQAGVQRSRMVNEGDFILSNSMSFGRPYIMKTSGCIHDGWLVLSDKKHVFDQDYLYYFLGSDIAYRQFDSLAAGSTVRNLNIESAKKVKVPLPPIAEQKRIAAILDEAFAGIAAATTNAEKNLANARELSTSYVGAVFASKDGEWTERPLGEICENLDSRRIPITKSDRLEGRIPYYGASGIVDYVAEHIFDEDILLISEDGANLLARTYPIAFSVSGKCWVNNHAHVVRFADKATQRMVEFFLNSISLVPYVSGMAQPKLNQQALNSIIVPLPTLEDQARIVGQIEVMQEESRRLEDNYKQKLAMLNELKQTILQKAFSGELTTHPEAALQEEAA